MLTAGELMTRKVYTLRLSDSLLTAREIMEFKRVRHVPVVGEADRFLGLITHRDLLTLTISRLAGIDQAAQEEIDSSIPVLEIMRTDVRTIKAGCTVREAAEILLEHKYGCLPVLDKERLVGIITEADFLKLTIALIDELERNAAR